MFELLPTSLRPTLPDCANFGILSFHPEFAAQVLVTKHGAYTLQSATSGASNASDGQISEPKIFERHQQKRYLPFEAGFTVKQGHAQIPEVPTGRIVRPKRRFVEEGGFKRPLGRAVDRDTRVDVARAIGQRGLVNANPAGP